MASVGKLGCGQEAKLLAMSKRWVCLILLAAVAGCGSGKPLQGTWRSEDPNFPAFGLKGSLLKFDEKNVTMANGKTFPYTIDGNRLHISFPDAAEASDAQFSKGGDSMTISFEGKEHEYKQVKD